jgi:hypothetical protein
MASLPRRMPSTHASSSSPPRRSGARSVWWCWRPPRRILTRPSTHGSRRWSPRSPSSSSSSPSSIPSSHARGRCWTPCHQASSRVGLRLHDLCRDPSPSTLKGIASTHLTGIVGMGGGVYTHIHDLVKGTFYPPPPSLENPKSVNHASIGFGHTTSSQGTLGLGAKHLLGKLP